MSRSTPARTAPIVTAAALDAALILVFVLIGRRNHEEALSLGGIVQTAWPFLVGAAAGWLAMRAWRRPFAVWPTGAVVWAATVGGGMLLRVASGQGVQPAFVIVAALTLAAMLLGWRLVALLVTRRANRTRRVEADAA
ncbi:DUF3054 domain-containing protein [Agromyces sp. SYSU K20354]|uniref:DUF3054 domain-containing protein n=1 Tax=Agromyces cavernae TaxID=2898659 RepID=UPI001E4CCAFB|nr:DUF3054 domain-containing protein [Agromyces cavernae]MCD2442863.1 DUF3054 domain-containing protein [Agromyces cavernae]